MQTLQQAESISAFAEYCDLASPKASNLKRILAFLHALPGWELEVSLGLQSEEVLVKEKYWVLTELVECRLSRMGFIRSADLSLGILHALTSSERRGRASFSARSTSKLPVRYFGCHHNRLR